MERRLRFAAGVLAGLSLLPPISEAADGFIGLYFADWEWCETIPCQGFSTLHVWGILAGASQAGITGAEYKVMIGPNDDADPQFFFMEIFDPTATVLGGGAFSPPDPLPRGINVAWPACQIGDGLYVLLESVTIVNLGCSTDELRLQVVKHDRASNQYFQCPLFVLCDAPVYTKVCTGSDLHLCRNPEPPNANDATCSTGGFAYLNPARSCVWAVESTTWTALKQLYRAPAR